MLTKPAATIRPMPQVLGFAIFIICSISPNRHLAGRICMTRFQKIVVAASRPGVGSQLKDVCAAAAAVAFRRLLDNGGHGTIIAIMQLLQTAIIYETHR
jgi:hypothetical protein